jgi:hypothetical protein
MYIIYIYICNGKHVQLHSFMCVYFYMCAFIYAYAYIYLHMVTYVCTRYTFIPLLCPALVIPTSNLELC